MPPKNKMPESGSSATMSIRMPVDLKARIKKLADADGRSASNFVNMAVLEYIKKKK